MNSRQKIIAIIPARGGSEGIPSKNIINICKKPLIAWSILHAKSTPEIHSVWVTSDSDEILNIAQQYGANPIKRPENLSTSTASSESAWLHALQEIEKILGAIDLVVGMQATSPIREPSDISMAIKNLINNEYDSLLSVSELEDYFIWEVHNGNPMPVNYNKNDRKMRQSINKSYLENGSFYIFKSSILKSENNRLGGKMGIHLMDKHKMFQIDNKEDIKLCESIMRGYDLDKYE